MLGSCHKPAPIFTLDKDTYGAGDEVTITNTSKSTDHFTLKVFDPDGNVMPVGLNITPDRLTGTFPNAPQNKILNFKLSIFAKVGVYRIEMKAYSQNEKKYSTLNKNFILTYSLGPVRITATPYLFQGHGYQEWGNFCVDGESLNKAIKRTNVDNTVDYMLPTGLRVISASLNSPNLDASVWVEVRQDQLSFANISF